MRGDLEAIAMQGDFGKPRLALVIQITAFNALETVTVLPVTGTLMDAPLLRVSIQPSAENGLKMPSQVMVDKAMTVRREKLGPAFGRANAKATADIERCLAVFLGIAK